jgi:hypothetical protein
VWNGFRTLSDLCAFDDEALRGEAARSALVLGWGRWHRAGVVHRAVVIVVSMACLVRGRLQHVGAVSLAVATGEQSKDQMNLHHEW